jgi:hypothetical protein
MKRILTGLFAAAILASSPAWAGGGHGHDRGDKEWKHEQKHREKEWRKLEKHARKHDRREIVVHQFEPRVIEHVHYVQPEPVYYAPPPAALNIIIPLR